MCQAKRSKTSKRVKSNCRMRSGAEVTSDALQLLQRALKCGDCFGWSPGRKVCFASRGATSCVCNQYGWLSLVEGADKSQGVLYVSNRCGQVPTIKFTQPNHAECLHIEGRGLVTMPPTKLLGPLEVRKGVHEISIIIKPFSGFHRILERH